MRGKIISVEGIEGAGKSTVIQFLVDFLRQRGHTVVSTREPGGTPLAENIRHLLLQTDMTESITPETELLLMFAARAQHIQHVVKPALQAGKWVVSDRFVDASYAYQGGGRQVDYQRIAWLDTWIVADCQPEIVFLLDIEPALGLARAKNRPGSQDRIELEKEIFFTQVRAAYLQRAHENPTRFCIIDATQTPAQVCAAIARRLEML